MTAASPKAFEQALGMVRRGGTIVLNGLPPGSFPLPIIDVVLDGIQPAPLLGGEHHACLRLLS